MIKVEPCKGCGGVILVDDFMGLRVRCNPTPLDAHAAGAALLAGQSLYRVRYVSGRPSSFGSASTDVLRALRGEPSDRPMVVVQHRCAAEAAEARLTASGKVKVPEEATCPKGPEKPAQRAARGRSAEHATPRLSSDPVCEACGVKIQTGEQMVGIQLGELYVYAQHVANCA